MMPVDRNPVKIEGPLEAMASSDNHRAGLLVWNNSAFQRRLDLHMDNLPFKKGTVRLYRVDRENASYDDNAPEEVVPTETFEDIDTTSFAWLDGYIPPYGIIYLEAEDGTGILELTVTNIANVIRINHYYPERGKTSSYADFDRKTWIARIGMMDNADADERIGVLANNLPETLDVKVKVEGNLQKINSESMLGIRIDYRTNGAYTKSVLFHGPYKGLDLYSQNSSAAIPWDQKEAVDETIAVEDLSSFKIELKKLSTAGWNGTAHISFLMRSAGAGTRAKFTIRKGE